MRRDRRRARRALPRPRLERSRRARRHPGRSRRQRRIVALGSTTACATRRRRGRVRGRGRAQGRGIGTRLLERLAALAAEAGHRALRRRGDAGQPRDARRFRRCRFEVTRELDGGEFEVRFPIASTEPLPLARRRARPPRGRPPRCGPSSSRVGRRDRRLAPPRLDRRRALPEHPRRRLRRRRPIPSTWAESRSRACARTRDRELPDVVDLAVICLPGAAGARGRRGGARERRQGSLRHLLRLRRDRRRRAASARSACSASCAPTAAASSGRTASASPFRRLGLNATFAPRALPPGPSRFSSQSGALGLALLEKASERGLGFSAFVSIGNKADVSSNDLLEWWEDDDETDARPALPRVVRQPAQFARLARRVARRKPILALKAGSTEAGARAASSHTAALAGSDAAVDALFHQAGVCAPTRSRSWSTWPPLLSSQPLPAAAAWRVLDQRRRSRDPLRRRLRGGRARAA